MGPIRNIRHASGDSVQRSISAMTTGGPYPPKSRRKRHANTTPGDFPISPSDSGYASGYISTPENIKTSTATGYTSPDSPTPEVRRWQSTLTKDDRSPIDLHLNLDGNLSESDEPFIQSATVVLEDKASLHPVARRRASGNITPRKSATLPKYTRTRQRPALPVSFSSDLHIRKRHNGLNTGLSYPASIRQPDRFIPARAEDTESIADIFRTGRPAHEMTMAERLLRHQGATEDAFCYRRRVMTPLASNYRPQTFSEASASSNWTRVGHVLGVIDQNTNADTYAFGRQVSNGAVWAVGGVAPGGTAVNNGRGQLVRSGTNARLFRTTFPTAKPKAEEEIEKHGARVATALGLDRTRRVLGVNVGDSYELPPLELNARTQWNGTEWIKTGPLPIAKKSLEMRTLPIAPFKVLDAPNLRDDFYCSILAYSAYSNTLAVGLGNFLYSWSDTSGVKLLSRGMVQRGDDGDCHITSVAFSSEMGRKSILAFARSNSTLGLMSMEDAGQPPLNPSLSALIPRMEIPQPAPVSSLAWKPVTTMRASQNPLNSGGQVHTEELLAGNEFGVVTYYSVEWPSRWEVKRDNWPGCFSILAVIKVHSQQICGLAWSGNGNYFASGGNDNLCHLFDTLEVSKTANAAGNITDKDHEDYELQHMTSSFAHSGRNLPANPAQSFKAMIKPLGKGTEKYRWVHGAAVKAIAFCPWQEGLVATGGGSNDKCIHFFHTTSGAPLATISVSAQVTSLIWSATRREIAATFGYAQPEHPVRIAVFSWPNCRQVAAIPWVGEHRALYAVSYPRRLEEARGSAPESEPGACGSRGRHRHSRSGTSSKSMEGCIMVASSDKSVKFHEIWPANSKITAGKAGILGGSDILESLEGIDRDEGVIR